MTAPQAGAVIACFRPKILFARWRRMLSGYCLIRRTGNACLSRSKGGVVLRIGLQQAQPHRPIDLPVEVGEAALVAAIWSSIRLLRWRARASIRLSNCSMILS